MNYETATDFDINKAVGVLRGFKEEIQGTYSYGDGFFVYSGGLGDDSITIYDYCNNPSDMWPIILEHKISIEHESLNSESFKGGWCAMGEYMDSDFSLVDVWSENENPLRACAIVYLKMKEKS